MTHPSCGALNAAKAIAQMLDGRLKDALADADIETIAETIDDEVDVAGAIAEADEAARDLAADAFAGTLAKIYEAAVAAEHGVAGAGAALVAMIEREAPPQSDLPSHAMASLLAVLRPADFYRHE